MNQNVFEMLAQSLQQHSTMALATSDGRGAVDCCSVFYAVDEQGGLVFSTEATSQKVANLSRSKKAAAVMDDQKQAGIQIRGHADALTGPSTAAAKQLLLERHPTLARFLEKPNLLFYRLVPEETFLINFAWGVDWRVPVK